MPQSIGRKNLAEEENFETKENISREEGTPIVGNRAAAWPKGEKLGWFQRITGYLKPF